PRLDEFRERRSDRFRLGGERTGRGADSGRGLRRDRGEGPESGPGPGPGPGGPIEGAAIIEIDRSVILKELVPALKEKHFSSHDETPYRIAIVTQGNTPHVLYSSAGEWNPAEIAEPDAAVNLFGAPGPPEFGRRNRGGSRALFQGSVI